MTSKDWYSDIAESYELPHRPVMVTSESLFDRVLDKFKRIGLRRWTDGVRPPSTRREYIVTLTNNVRAIETSAQLALKHCDERKYPQAHLDLDIIESKVRMLRTHIDHLQNVSDFCARPAGD